MLCIHEAIMSDMINRPVNFNNTSPVKRCHLPLAY